MKGTVVGGAAPIVVISVQRHGAGAEHGTVWLVRVWSTSFGFPLPQAA